MTSARDDGGPAFPCEIGPGADGGFQSGNERWTVPGLSIRDYFAAEALRGLMGRDWSHMKDAAPAEVFSTWATSAYAAADAMLIARQASREIQS